MLSDLLYTYYLQLTVPICTASNDRDFGLCYNFSRDS